VVKALVAQRNMNLRQSNLFPHIIMPESRRTVSLDIAKHSLNSKSNMYFNGCLVFKTRNQMLKIDIKNVVQNIFLKINLFHVPT